LTTSHKANLVNYLRTPPV